MPINKAFDCFEQERESLLRDLESMRVQLIKRDERAEKESKTWNRHQIQLKREILGLESKIQGLEEENKLLKGKVEKAEQLLEASFDQHEEDKLVISELKAQLRNSKRKQKEIVETTTRQASQIVSVNETTSKNLKDNLHSVRLKLIENKKTWNAEKSMYTTTIHDLNVRIKLSEAAAQDAREQVMSYAERYKKARSQELEAQRRLAQVADDVERIHQDLIIEKDLASKKALKFQEKMSVVTERVRTLEQQLLMHQEDIDGLQDDRNRLVSRNFLLESEAQDLKSAKDLADDLNNRLERRLKESLDEIAMKELLRKELEISFQHATSAIAEARSEARLSRSVDCENCTNYKHQLGVQQATIDKLTHCIAEQSHEYRATRESIHENNASASQQRHRMTQTYPTEMHLRNQCTQTCIKQAEREDKRTQTLFTKDENDQTTQTTWFKEEKNQTTQTSWFKEEKHRMTQTMDIEQRVKTTQTTFIEEIRECEECKQMMKTIREQEEMVDRLSRENGVLTQSTSRQMEFMSKYTALKEELLKERAAVQEGKDRLRDFTLSMEQMQTLNTEQSSLIKQLYEQKKTLDAKQQQTEEECKAAIARLSKDYALVKEQHEEAVCTIRNLAHQKESTWHEMIDAQINAEQLIKQQAQTIEELLERNYETSQIEKVEKLTFEISNMEIELKRCRAQNEALVTQIESVPDSLLGAQAECQVLREQLQREKERYSQDLETLKQDMEEERKNMEHLLQASKAEKAILTRRIQEQSLTIHQLTADTCEEMIKQSKTSIIAPMSQRMQSSFYETSEIRKQNGTFSR